MLLMRNIYELVEQNSNDDPGGIAILSPTSTFSNLELLKSVDSVADRLFEAGLRPGQLAFTQLEADLDWITTLALAKLGLSSGSITEEPGLVPEYVDWLITSVIDHSPREPKRIFLDHGCLAISEDSVSTVEVHSFEDDEAFRVIMTSGTSGEPKAALYKFGAISTKVGLLKNHWQAPGRELNLMGLASIGGFATALSCLGSARPYITGSRLGTDLVAYLNQSGVETLSGSPFQIAQLLNFLTRTQSTLPMIKSMRLAGSTPSLDLVGQILEDFDVQLVSVYGSTECGGVFSQELTEDTDLSSLGSLLPFASAMIMDEHGKEVPEGQHGMLATKSAAMFSGYLGEDGELLDESVGGWFLTGDTAVKSQGNFFILGRESDILNVGGVKLDAAPIDAYALGYPGVTEAVTFETTGQLGQPMLAMAYVGTDEVKTDEFSKYMVDRFPNSAPQVIGQVTLIPRTAMGKPIRSQLGKLFRDLLVS